jgi:hypothetical protein
VKEVFVRLAGLLAAAVSAAPVYAQYAGPAVLSRGDAPSSMASSQIDFRPFVNFAGVYTAGLSGLASSGTGQTTDFINSAGFLLSFGISGMHSWQHTKLGVDYVGSITRYTRATYGDFDNQALLFTLNHEFTPHINFTLHGGSTISSQPLLAPSLPQTVNFDPTSIYNPTTDFYSSRTLSENTVAALTLQKSARLSFNMSGFGSLVDRHGQGLYSVTGVGATGDVQYRLSSHTTAGANYSYMHYEFHGTFNATDSHSVSGTYAIKLSPSVEVSGFGGVTRMETKFVQSVPISPVLAVLIGLRSASIINHSIFTHPSYNMRLSKTFPRGVAYLGSSYSITPGNGLFLTSTALAGTAGYSYTALKGWGFGVNGGYTRATSITNVIGEYASMTGGISAAHQLSHFLHVTCNALTAKYSSSGFAGYNQFTYSVNLGLAFSPGDVPLRVW